MAVAADVVAAAWGSATATAKPEMPADGAAGAAEEAPAAEGGAAASSDSRGSRDGHGE